MDKPRRATRWRSILVWIVIGSLFAFLAGFGSVGVAYASLLVGVAALWLLCVGFVLGCIMRLIGRVR